MANVAGNIVGVQSRDGLMRKKKLAETWDARGIGGPRERFFLLTAPAAHVENVLRLVSDGRTDEADSLVDAVVRETIARGVVRGRIGELVRRKPGGGGWVLYAPNKKGKGEPKPVGNFPTRMGAKRAELSRFPPKELGKLKRLRKEIDRLQKDPKRRAEKELKARRESVDIVSRAVVEALFREETPGTKGWDEYVARLPARAMSDDRKLQRLQKAIERGSETAIGDATASVSKALRKHGFRVQVDGVKKDRQRQRAYAQFNVEHDGTTVGPFHVYVEAGLPKIEISDQARSAIGRLDRDVSRELRAELMTVQEDVLDHMDDVTRAIAARDKYLSRLEAQVDAVVSDMGGLEVCLLRNLLTKRRGK